jgi:hypothetical protein
MSEVSVLLPREDQKEHRHTIFTIIHSAKTEMGQLMPQNIGKLQNYSLTTCHLFMSVFICQQVWFPVMTVCSLVKVVWERSGPNDHGKPGVPCDVFEFNAGIGQILGKLKSEK